MKENKLSRERLKIWAYRFHDAWNQSSEIFQEEEGKQAYAQIKSLLQPIPEDKLDKFINEQAEIMCNFRTAPKVFKDYKLAVKFMLKAYDTLREEGKDE